MSKRQLEKVYCVDHVIMSKGKKVLNREGHLTHAAAVNRRSGLLSRQQSCSNPVESVTQIYEITMRYT